MKTVRTAEIASQIETILDQVEQGEEVVIERNGEPVARLVRVEALKKVDRSAFFGALKGKIWMAPDWDAPMTEEELSEWYGKDTAGDTSSTPTS